MIELYKFHLEQLKITYKRLEDHEMLNIGNTPL